MSFSPLTPVTDYQSMLNRIFWFTTVAALVGVWMLRMNVTELDTLLSRIDFTVDLGGNKILPMPGGYLIPALLSLTGVLITGPFMLMSVVYNHTANFFIFGLAGFALIPLVEPRVTRRVQPRSVAGRRDRPQALPTPPPAV